MVQYLKEEVQAAIARSALEVFASRGFRGATIADIAKKAGTSAGNVYRYYENKEVLFYEVVSEAFTTRFIELVRRRVESLRGVDDVAALGPEAPFHAISEELLRFGIDNRLRIVVLLGRAEGTHYEGFADDLREQLIELALSHFRRLAPDRRVGPTTRFVLDQIYRSWMKTLVSILSRYRDGARIKAAVDDYSRYHLAGLRGLFD